MSGENEVKKGSSPDERCKDCLRKGCTIWAKGEMLPGGMAGFFDSYCWPKRVDYWNAHKEPKPFGLETGRTSAKPAHIKLLPP